jgi:hypothetical protein
MRASPDAYALLQLYHIKSNCARMTRVVEIAAMRPPEVRGRQSQNRDESQQAGRWLAHSKLLVEWLNLRTNRLDKMLALVRWWVP